MPFEASRILSTSELVSLIAKFGAKLDLNQKVWQSIAVENDFASPFICSDYAYHWIVRERGEEISRKTTGDPDQLIYWVFESLTFKLAGDFALKHRDTQSDFRRVLFQKQLDLIEQLNTDWRPRLAAQLNAVLSRAPFADETEPRTVS